MYIKLYKLKYKQSRSLTLTTSKNCPVPPGKNDFQIFSHQQYHHVWNFQGFIPRIFSAECTILIYFIHCPNVTFYGVKISLCDAYWHPPNASMTAPHKKIPIRNYHPRVQLYIMIIFGRSLLSSRLL